MNTQKLICFSIRGLKDIKDGNEILHKRIKVRKTGLSLLLIRFTHEQRTVSKTNVELRNMIFYLDSFGCSFMFTFLCCLSTQFPPSSSVVLEIFIVPVESTSSNKEIEDCCRFLDW